MASAFAYLTAENNSPPSASSLSLTKRAQPQNCKDPVQQERNCINSQTSRNKRQRWCTNMRELWCSKSPNNDKERMPLCTKDKQSAVEQQQKETLHEQHQSYHKQQLVHKIGCKWRFMQAVFIALAIVCGAYIWVFIREWRTAITTFPYGDVNSSFSTPGLRPNRSVNKNRIRSFITSSLKRIPKFAPPKQVSVDIETERVMDVYCRGPLLHAVQMANVFPDSKHFVDMPIKSNSSVFDILMDFDRRKLSMTDFRFDEETKTSHDFLLREFISEHFDSPGTDLIPITPCDYQEHYHPPMIAQIQNPEYRDWAFALHQLWRTLGRVPNPQTKSSILHPKKGIDNHDKHHPERPHHVLIVPGGRFRESYYWDSYWIVQGLFVSNMKKTARGVVVNLLEYAAEFGFVPNGGRIYYLTRSQPPMLSDMVKLVAQVGHNATAIEYDKSYLKAALPIIEKEYNFWMQRGPGGHAVEVTRLVKDKNGNQRSVTYVLNRYTSSANHPRPESYREDVAIAAEIYGDTIDAEDGNAATTSTNKVRYYNDVIAAAESGWDFSSRWLRNQFDMKSMFTSCVVPVDLNAIMYRMEQNLMTFHRYVGNRKRARFFEEAAKQRRAAIDAILWSEDFHTWRDFNLETESLSTIASISDYTPLWARAFDPDDKDRLHNIIQSLKNSGLLHSGGIQTTNVFTGQQWDSPNAWPPEQDIIIEGLLAVNTEEAHELARQLAQTWVHTSFTAWKQTGLMFEKYNASEIGGLGVGGEYFPQFGFGWTNGVILKFLTVYQNLLLP